MICSRYKVEITVSLSERALVGDPRERAPFVAVSAHASARGAPPSAASLGRLPRPPPSAATMHAARAALRHRRAGANGSDADESNDDDDAPPPPHGRSMPFAVQGRMTGSPLDLVAQLRGDFEAYTRELDGGLDDTGFDDLRTRRQRERMQLDSLHARLHGLRLILAMAQLHVAADAEQERGSRLELMGGAEADYDGSDGGGNGNVVLLSFTQPEPQGVPAKQLEEIVPKSSAEGDVLGTCCSICISDVEAGEVVRKLPHCKHVYHASCVDRWFARSVRAVVATPR